MKKMSGFFHYQGVQGPLLSVMPLTSTGLVSAFFYIPHTLKDSPPLPHLTEHMVFNGTQSLSQKDFYNQISFYGGYFNGFTRHDFTCFYFISPKENFPFCMELMLNMIYLPALSRENFDKEKKVISREIQKDNTGETNRADQIFNKYFYKGDIYSNTVMGTSEEVQNIKLDQVREFHRQRYNPRNTRIWILGDISPESALFYTEKLMKNRGVIAVIENFRRCDGNTHLYPPPPHQDYSGDGRVFRKKAEDISNIYLYLAIKSPGTGSPYFPGFCLLSDLIPLPLEQNLKSYKGFLGIKTLYLFWREGGALIIRSTLSGDTDMKRFMPRFEEELRNSLFMPVSPSLLKNRLKSEKGFFHSQQENIHTLGITEARMMVHLSPREYEEFYKKLEKITPSELKKIAGQTFLQPEIFCLITGRNIQEDTPSIINPSTFTPLPPVIENPIPPEEKIPSTAGGRRKKIPGITAGIYQQEEDSLRKKIEIPGGTVFIIEQTPQSRITAIHIMAKDPCLYEDPARRGTSEILSHLIEEGYGKYSHTAFQDKLNSLGAGIYSGHNLSIPLFNYFEPNENWNLGMEILNEEVPKGMELLQDILNINENNIDRIRPDIFQGVKDKIINRLHLDSLHSHFKAFCLFITSLMGEHPYSVPFMGDQESLSRITPQDVLSLKNRLLSPSNLIISISSSIEAEKIEKMIFRKFDIRQDNQKSPELPPLSPPRYGKFSEITRHSTVTLMLGFPIKIREEDIPSLLVLSGMFIARFSLVMREEMGLAYNLGGDPDINPYRNYYRIFLETSGENIPIIQDLAESLLFGFKKEYINYFDVQRAKNHLKARFLRDLLTSSRRAGLLSMDQLLKRPPDYRKRLIEKIGEIDVWHIIKARELYFSPSKIIRVLVG